MYTYYRVEAFGGARAPLKEMHSKIGPEQVAFECEICGHIKDDLLEPCDECGEQASHANSYAQMIRDLDLEPDEEELYILPGILTFGNRSDAEEYANRVSGGVLCEYTGEELYYGTREPDYGADEFLIRPKKRNIIRQEE